MTQTASDRSSVGTGAAGFTRPLLLTARQDLYGYLLSVLGRLLLLAITCTSIVAIILIFLFIMKESLPFFSQYGLWTLFRGASADDGWYPTANPPDFSGLPLIFGSLQVTGIAMLVAVPIGMLTAVLLSDILPFNVRQIVKPIIEILAAIPSVAYGFFALLVVAPWLQETVGLSSGTNAGNAGVILAIMAIPTIVSISEDALTAAGRELREASYGLGATRFETIWKVVIPAARSGILAAVILGIMRAIGETMVVWMAAGNAAWVPEVWYGWLDPGNMAEPVRTMTATIAAEMAEAPKNSEHYHSLFAVGALLLAFTFLLNLASEHFMARTRRIAGGRKK